MMRMRWEDCEFSVSKNGKFRFLLAVLEIPPIDSAETAVKVAIAAKARAL